MAKPEYWKIVFQGGALLGIVFILPCVLSFWYSYQASETKKTQAATIEIQQGTIDQLQKRLTYCQSISQGNYQAATAAQVENQQLRALVVEYQAQLQKGQAPSRLTEFLLKLLVQ